MGSPATSGDDAAELIPMFIDHGIHSVWVERWQSKPAWVCHGILQPLLELTAEGRIRRGTSESMDSLPVFKLVGEPYPREDILIPALPEVTLEEFRHVLETRMARFVQYRTEGNFQEAQGRSITACHI
jgi:hypothetical protein